MLRIDSLIVNTFVNNVKVMTVQKLDHIKKINHKYDTTFEMVNIKPINFYLKLKNERNRKKNMLKLS